MTSLFWALRSTLAAVNWLTFLTCALAAGAAKEEACTAAPSTNDADSKAMKIFLYNILIVTLLVGIMLIPMSKYRRALLK
ncbi:hypothetical protein D3C75_1074330 [compost metagenome]